MTNVLAVANRFIMLARQDGRSFNTQQLMKLCIIAQGMHLTIYHKKMFDEKIEAWKLGTVVPKLYKVLKPFRGNPIKEPVKSWRFLLWDNYLSDAEKAVVQMVYENFGYLDGTTLSMMTNQREIYKQSIKMANKENFEVTHNYLLSFFYDKVISIQHLTDQAKFIKKNYCVV